MDELDQSRDMGEHRFWVWYHAAERTCYDQIAANNPVGSLMLYKDEWQSDRGNHSSHATAALMTYLRAFQDVHKQYLHLYMATYEAMLIKFCINNE